VITTRGVLLASAALAALAGCTSGSRLSAGQPVPATSDAVIVPSSSAASTAVSSSSSGSVIPISPSSSSASSSPATASTSVAPPAVASCTASQLSIDVAKGGASLGQEIAIVTFTNSSTSACALMGYPAAQLEDSKGHAVGSAATHARGTVVRFVLGAGQAGQATLTAGTRCNAPVSSAVRIQAPDAPGSTEVPITLRACTLQITPVQPAG